MQKFVVFASASAIFLLGSVTAGPIEQQNYNESVVPFQPFNSSLQWSKSHVLTGFLGTVGALVLLIVVFQPMLIYNVCYALGGCQDTLDNYLDSLLGEARKSRRAKRDLENTDLDYAMGILKMAVQLYGPDSRQNEVQESAEPANHQVERRSPMDYIEPVLVMMSKMYSEFVDEEQKKKLQQTAIHKIAVLVEVIPIFASVVRKMFLLYETLVGFVEALSKLFTVAGRLYV